MCQPIWSQLVSCKEHNFLHLFHKIQKVMAMMMMMREIMIMIRAVHLVHQADLNALAQAQLGPR